MKNKVIKAGERGLNILLIFFSIFAFIESVKLWRLDKAITSYGAFPLFISSLLLIFALWILMEKIKLPRKKYIYYIDKLKEIRELILYNEILVFLLMILGYSMFLERIGFSLSSLLFLWITITYLTKEDWVRNLWISLLTLGIILFIFRFAFKVILP